MKKFLSLALALIMTMSMVTISASADFADDASISYAEAVDVMAELDIIGGYADGSFAPTGTLTRGAAAKIICNMILGPTVAGALGADTAPFPDVSADHTFAGYIAYCVQQGILSGYSDGNFYPALEVNGNAFMKMLLCALGYDSDIEGFTGANWSVNVAKLALSLGLDDGDDVFQGTTAITREEACLYALNTLEATMVEYDSTASVTVGDISITSSSSYSKVETSKSASYDDNDDGYVQFCEEYFDDLEKDTSDTDAFGRPAVTWEYDGDEIGTYVNDDDLEESFVGLTSKDDIFEAISEDVWDDIDDGDYDLVVWVDGIEIDEDDYNLEYWAKENSSTYVAFRGSNTDVFVDDDEDVVTIVIINTYLVQAADDYDSSDEELDIDDLDDIEAIEYYTDLSSYSLSFQSSIDNDDVDVEDFEDEDYILVTIADGDIQTAVLAETVTGEVSTYSTSSSVTIDGTKYNYSKAFTNTDESYSVGDDAGVVLDQQGYVIYIDDAIVASDRYVFVTDFDYSSSFSTYTYYAAAYFSDGTYAEIQLDELYGDDADDMLEVKGDEVVAAEDDTDYANKWYTYTTNSDGTYDLTEVEDDYMYDTDTVADLYKYYTTDDNDELVSNGTVKFASGGTLENLNDSSSDLSDLRGDSETVFIIVDEDDDVYMYTGISNVADVTGKGTLWALMDGSYAAFVFVDGSEADVDGASTATYDYMFVLEYEKTTTDTNGDTVYEYTVIIDGEKVEIISVDSLYEGYLYEDVDVDSDGYVDDWAKVDDSDKYDGTDSIYYDTVSNYVFSRSNDILDADFEDFIIGSDATVYVIVNDGVDVLLDDDGADYEVNEFSTAKNAANFLDNASVDARIAVVVSDDDTTDVVDMFIYVTAADEDEVEDDKPSFELNDDYDFKIDTDKNVTVGVYNGADSDANSILYALIAYLESKGYEYDDIDTIDRSACEVTMIDGLMSETFTIDLSDATNDVTVFYTVTVSSATVNGRTLSDSIEGYVADGDDIIIKLVTGDDIGNAANGSMKYVSDGTTLANVGKMYENGDSDCKVTVTYDEDWGDLYIEMDFTASIS